MKTKWTNIAELMMEDRDKTRRNCAATLDNSILTGKRPPGADMMFYYVPIRASSFLNTEGTELEDNDEAIAFDNYLECQISDILHRAGMPAHIRGFHYVRESIKLSVNDCAYIESITKLLYPTVAKVFNTTPSSVERAIRHAIEITWVRGDVNTLDSYFEYKINNKKGKPTNSEFVATISDRLRLQLKSKMSIIPLAR